MEQTFFPSFFLFPRSTNVIMSECEEDGEGDEDEQMNSTKILIQFCFVWYSGLVIGVIVNF